jgi:hypothetical protein
MRPLFGYRAAAWASRSRGLIARRRIDERALPHPTVLEIGREVGDRCWRPADQ